MGVSLTNANLLLPVLLLFLELCFTSSFSVRAKVPLLIPRPHPADVLDAYAHILPGNRNEEQMLEWVRVEGTEVLIVKHGLLFFFHPRPRFGGPSRRVRRGSD